MGFGSAPSVATPDPMAEAQAQIELERQQAALAEEQRIAAEARAAEQRAADLGIFNTRVADASSVARQSALDAILGRGLQADPFVPQIDQELNRIRTTIPELDQSPGVYFDQDIADIVLGRETDRLRNQYRSQLTDFAAPGFSSQYIPNIADDAIIDSILNEQYTPAAESLQRAQARGTLTDTGFSAAQQALNSQRQAASSKLQDIGLGVLGEGRSVLEDIANQALNQASTYELGQNFNPQNIQSQLQDRASTFTSGLEGRFRNALGGEQLFDVDSLVARGGTAQGAQNTSPALLAALAQRNQQRNQTRQLGAEGTF